MPRPDAARAVYGISVAAELVGLGVQTLRLYEARGLLEPARTDGGTRRYSADDLDRLRRIGDLLDAGLNLAGIAVVMDLQDENTRLRAQKEGTQMAPDRIDPLDQIPEADLLEQQIPLEEPLTGTEHLSVVPESPMELIDEADRWEQHVPVPLADDDYPHEPFEAGRS